MSETPEAKMYECDKFEWWDVCRFISPDKDWDEFEREWEEFQRLKRSN